MKNITQGSQLSNHTFFVDRSVFSNTFPELNGDRLRVYLLMCRVVGATPYGNCFMSISTISNEVNLSEHYTRKAIDWLISNYFIKKKPRPLTSNLYRVLITPDFNRHTSAYYSNEEQSRDRFNLKDSLNGYCEMPIEIMEGSILRDRTLWTDRKIKVLGQLYLFHWIGEYGGVDPNVCYFIKYTMYISDLLCYTIGCHKNDIQRTINWLVKIGLAKKVKAIYRVNPNSHLRKLQYIGDASEFNALPGDVFKFVIRLSCVPSLKVKNALVRTGGNIAI